MKTLEELVKTAVEKFKEDTLACSIITSWIESKQQWYVSVVRWRGPRKEMARQVVFGVCYDSLEECYIEAVRRLA